MLIIPNSSNAFVHFNDEEKKSIKCSCTSTDSAIVCISLSIYAYSLILFNNRNICFISPTPKYENLILTRHLFTKRTQFSKKY